MIQNNVVCRFNQIFSHVSKGQLISKCLFQFSQKTNENNLTWDTIVVVKSNFFDRFLGELKIPKRHFEINWHLVAGRISEFQRPVNTKGARGQEFIWQILVYVAGSSISTGVRLYTHHIITRSHPGIFRPSYGPVPGHNLA